MRIESQIFDMIVNKLDGEITLPKLGQASFYGFETGSMISSNVVVME
jgi:hypothetical protein